MGVSETITRAAQTDVQPAPLDITVGEVAARRLQPRAKPEAGDFGYLDAERGVPVPCAVTELADACLSGKAVLVWTPETAEMVAPHQVPHLAAAILQANFEDARSRRLGWLVLLALVSVIALFFPAGWFFAAGVALLAWSANLRVRAAEGWTEADVIWQVSEPEPASPTLPTPKPYSLSMGSAVAVIALAQVAVLGQEWLDGMWQPGPPDGDWLGLLGGPLLHPDVMTMIFGCFVLGGLGTALEEEAPRAYLPLSFVAGMLAAMGADLFLPGSPTPGAMAGLMGMAGFYAVLAARHAGRDPFMDRPAGPVLGVSASGLVLAVYLALAPLNGAGLLAGITLGLLCIPRPGELAEGDSLDTGGWTEWLGLSALGMIWLSTLAAIASLVLG